MRLKSAVAMVGHTPGVLARYHTVEDIMEKILSHKEDEEYMRYLIKSEEYRTALVYLSDNILNQPNLQPDSTKQQWFDMKRKVVLFMFDTADPKALEYVRTTPVNTYAVLSDFHDILGRFSDLAWDFGDLYMATITAELQTRTDTGFVSTVY